MNYKKTIEKVEQELKKNLEGKKAIIGISGGIDSAVVATLCTRAVGRDRVIGILIPYGKQDIKDAESLVKCLKIKSRKINIKEIADRFDFLKLDKTNKGNVMARIRMAILYAFANHLNGLVIGTGNKTEIEIGYFTKYGDGGVDIKPIGEIYKTEIFEIAKILSIPKSIIERKPSAELYEGQTDEGEIGALYSEIDAVLKGEINSGRIYEKIQTRKKKSEHKRKMPLVFLVRDGK